MARRTLWVGLVAIAGLFLASPTARAADEPSITGTYDCVGDNSDGKEYKGKVTISKKGDTYILEWTIGKETHFGIGLLRGNTLSSSWATVANGKVIKGIVIYKVQKNKLVGEWAQYPGDGKVLKETLTRSSD